MRWLRKRADNDRADRTYQIYYASDLHGSDRCWRKFLGAGRFYGVQALIMGGDLTGKAIVPIELAADGRCEGADLLEVGRVELRQGPFPHLELALGHRLRRVERDFEQERVRVAEHRRAAEGREAVEGLRRFRPALHDVAEADDLVHAEPFDVLERRPERDVVRVLVRDEREAHAQSLDLIPARPLRTHSGWFVQAP